MQAGEVPGSVSYVLDSLSLKNVKSPEKRHGLKRAQRGVVCLLIMAMAVVLLNRKYVPYFLRPEYYEMEAAQRAAFLQWSEERVQLDGRPLLFIGDSMAAGCHWPDADVLALPGGDPEQVMDFVGEHIGDRRYATIVVWMGTARASHVKGQIPRMTRMLTPHSNRMVVIAPMPNDRPPDWFDNDALWITLPKQDQQHLVADMRAQLPAATVLDPSPLRTDAENLTDGLHLSERGFGELRAMLDATLAS